MNNWTHQQHIDQRQLDAQQGLDTDCYESCLYDIMLERIYRIGYNDAEYTDKYNPYKRDDYRRAWQMGNDARN